MQGREFQTVEGVKVADLTGVFEGYCVQQATEGPWVFTVNVSAERLFPVFRKLAVQVNDPGFFLFETGSHRDVEEQLRKSPADPFHKDVFYLDGIDVERALQLISEHERNLVHDGGVNFGYGSHEGTDEVFVGPYKILYIYADDPGKYREVLDELGFPRRDPLVTVWDNFGPDSPGERGILPDAKPTRWEMIEILMSQGLYFAERRES